MVGAPGPARSCASAVLGCLCPLALSVGHRRRKWRWAPAFLAARVWMDVQERVLWALLGLSSGRERRGGPQ